MSLLDLTQSGPTDSSFSLKRPRVASLKAQKEPLHRSGRCLTSLPGAGDFKPIQMALLPKDCEKTGSELYRQVALFYEIQYDFLEPSMPND
jgi:hypothetical protein